MFSAFNLIALAVGAALFIRVLAVAVAGTAHEGTPFGKRFSSLWMPVRLVGAMGALAPIFRGLPLFQVAILACIGFSINPGNYVWELGTEYFVEHGGRFPFPEGRRELLSPSSIYTQNLTLPRGAAVCASRAMKRRQ